MAESTIKQEQQTLYSGTYLHANTNADTQSNRASAIATAFANIISNNTAPTASIRYLNGYYYSVFYSRANTQAFVVNALEITHDNKIVIWKSSDSGANFSVSRTI